MPRFVAGGGADDAQPESEQPQSDQPQRTDPGGTEESREFDAPDDEDEEDDERRDDRRDDGGDPRRPEERDEMPVVEDAMTPPLTPTTTGDPAERPQDQADRGGRAVQTADEIPEVAADAPADDAAQADEGDADAPSDAGAADGTGLSETTTGGPAVRPIDPATDPGGTAESRAFDAPADSDARTLDGGDDPLAGERPAFAGRTDPGVAPAQAAEVETVVGEQGEQQNVLKGPTRDLNDTPIRNPIADTAVGATLREQPTTRPLAAERLEGVFRQQSQGAAQFSQTAAESEVNPLTVPGRTIAAAAEAADADAVATLARSGVGRVERTQTGAGAAVLGLPGDVGTLVKESGETAVGVAERDVGVGEVGVQAVRRGVESVQGAAANPDRAVGALIGGTVTGTAGVAGSRRLATFRRSRRIRREADAEFEIEEATNEQGAAGDLPTFDTDPGAPTREAVRELEERAADNPDVVTEAAGTDRVLFQSTEADLGAEFSARRGSSELPGLFTSGDVSPLRLREGAEQSGSLAVRLPRLSDLRAPSDRLAAFEGDRIEAMPDRATGSGRVRVGPDEFEPDPETSGARFLDEEAERGTAFVRPPGSRTTEQESIFPPGSQFRRETRLAGETPSGRTVPVDVFRRAEGEQRGGVEVDVTERVAMRTERIERQYDTEVSAPRRTPTTPLPAGTPATRTVGRSGGGRGGSGTGRATTDREAPTTTASTTGQGPSDVEASIVDEPTTAPPDRVTDAPSTGATTTTDPPTTGPPGTTTGPPSTAPPTTGPPSTTPPSTGPPTTGPPSTQPPTTGPPSTTPPTSITGPPTSGGLSGTTGGGGITDPTRFDTDTDRRRRDVDTDLFNEQFVSPVTEPLDALAGTDLGGFGDADLDAGVGGLDDA